MKKASRGRGRPPKPDAGAYEKLYVNLKTDLAAWVRLEAVGDRRSISEVLSRLVEEAIGHRLARKKRPVVD